MVDRKLLEQAATDTAKMIRREIMETYSNEEIRGLNGFFHFSPYNASIRRKSSGRSSS